MKRFYSRFRILLMTFALGMASVFEFHDTLKFSNEVQVNLPKTATGDLIVVFPKCRFQMPSEGVIGEAVVRLASMEGTSLTEKKLYKEPEKLTKCIENQNSTQK